MKAIDLKEGMEFKISGMRKNRKVMNVVELKGDNILPEHKNHVLITTEGCKQMIVPNDINIIINDKK